ncbi:MAG: hypothetical protein GOU98_01120 [Candidatus Altiarchaeota archaeon]|nr:hypothetical protein [Candidatus Altiarchaeota archaeon]
MDVLLIIALLLPFTKEWRKPLTALAFIYATINSSIGGYSLATFFFALSLMIMWLSNWKNAKYPLFFLAMFDLIGIINSQTLVELFIYFELAIYASYFLIFEHRKATLRYFIVNSVGSALMLFAIAISFFKTGLITALTPEATIFFVLGLLVKLGIAPFQDWLVEIYKSVDFEMRIFFSSVLTEISPLALLMVITRPSPTITAFALLSMLIANLMALSELSLLRLIALIDASNLAYDLVAISVASSASRVAALYMMFSHVLAITLVFAVIEASKAKSLKDLWIPRGLELPFYGAFLILAGLPPFHLFPSKIILFSSVFSIHNPLSYFLVVNMILSAFVALRIISKIKGSKSIKVDKKLKAVIIALFFLSLYLGLFPNTLFDMSASQIGLFTR